MTARAALNRAMTEAELQTAVIELARLRGYLIHHDRGDYRQTIQGDPGFPDLVLSSQGVTLFFEVKTEKGKLTSEQEAWRAALGASGSEDEDWDDLEAGGHYAVIRPSRWSSGQVAKALV